MQESEAAPLLTRYFQTLPNHPPPQPMQVLSHETKSYGEMITSSPDWIHILSEKASEAAKAQHEPQAP